MKKKSFNIINEYPLEDGLFPIKFESMKLKFQAYSIETKPVNQWHGKLWHFHPNRLHLLSPETHEIPQFSRTDLSNHQCVPWITAEALRSPIAPSTRYTSRPLELVHIDKSGPIERSLQNY